MTESAIEKLYKAIEKVAGPTEAKNSVSDVIYICISRLQDNNIPINEKNISDLVTAFANDFIEASKSDVA